jgi:hypothetical protein
MRYKNRVYFRMKKDEVPKDGATPTRGVQAKSFKLLQTKERAL